MPERHDCGARTGTRLILARTARALWLVTLALIVTACRSSSSATAADRAFPVLAGLFTGTVPCADCSGIRTDVTMLTNNPAVSAEGTFSLVEHYLGTRTGDRAFRRQGRWVMLKGTPSARDAAVYRLTADDGGRIMQLRRIDANTVRLLADDGSDQVTDMRYTLRRPGPSLLGGYREVDASMPDVREAADYAVKEHGARTGTDLTLRHVLWAARQVVSGVRFRMCIETAGAGSRTIVTVVVFRTFEQQLSLSEWMEGCEPVPPP